MLSSAHDRCQKSFSLIGGSRPYANSGEALAELKIWEDEMRYDFAPRGLSPSRSLDCPLQYRLLKYMV